MDQQNVGRQVRAKEALRLIVEGTAAAIGSDFFRACVRHLAAALQVQYAIVSEFANAAKTRVRSLAYWTGNDWGETVEYEIAQTPCETVLAGNIRHYPTAVQALFPHDRELIDMGIVSYLGIPLISTAGQVMGHLAVLDVKPMQTDRDRELILRIFAARTSAELERKQAEDALKASEAQYRDLVQTANCVIMRWLPTGHIRFVNEFGRQFFGYAADEMIGRHVVGTVVPETDSAGHDLRQLIENICQSPDHYLLHQNENICKNGDRVWLAWANKPIWDDQGQLQEFLSVATDITGHVRAEAALQVANAEMAALFAAMDDLVLVRDRAGRCQKILTPKATKLLYKPLPEMLGKTISEIFPADAATLLLDYVERAVTTQQTVKGEYCLTIANQLVWLNASVSPIDGERVVWVARDISDRKRMEDELQMANAEMRALFAAMNDLIFVKDRQGRYLKIPATNSKLLYKPAAELLGKTLHDVFPQAIADEFVGYIQQSLDTQQTLNVEYSLPIGGKDMWFDARISPIDTNAVVWVVRDITERKRIEAERIQAAAELKRAKEAADAASRAKSEFLANMSHELRSPLNAILGFAQLMSRNQSFSADQQENVNIILRSGEHLLSLINNILDLSKIEAGHTTLNETGFDLHALLDDLETMFRLRATEKGLQLVFDYATDLPRYIQTDQVKLRQVLINLLSNAIKFTQAGGVSLHVEQPIDPCSSGSSLGFAHLIFEVEDTGSGIAPDEIDQLFEAFSQTKTGREAQEGTGLGLVISRKFIQLMGGEMSVSCRLPQGTMFRFNIQATLADAAVVTSPERTHKILALAPGQPHYRILIVDDKFTNRQLMVKLLTPLGFAVKEASNGKEAIAVWDEWDPHLIWMDMRMPVMDGYEATKQIKSTTKGQATAVIALTASALEEQKAVVLSAGCDDFVRKPFREAEIFTTMQKHIGVRYVLADETPHSTMVDPVAELLPTQIHHLPPQWMADLQAAVNNIDLDLATTLIQQLRSENAPLADALQHNLDNFEYEQILATIQTVLDCKR